MARLIDVIKYEGDNETLIYKYPVVDFNIGTQLIVHQSQEAILFKDGIALQSFNAGAYTLDTKNIPFLKSILASVAGGQNFFHAEVYFINLTTQLGIKWGTDSKVRIIEPHSGIPVALGACGTFNLKVADGRKLLVKVVGTAQGLKQQQIFGSVGYFKGLIITKMKSAFARLIREGGYDIFEIDEYIDALSDKLREVINDGICDYGIYMPEFNITTITLPEDDASFIKLREQRAAQYLIVQEQKIKKAEAEAAQEVVVVQAQTEAKKKIIDAEAQATSEVTLGKGHGEALRAQGADYNMETARLIGTKAAENEGSGGSAIVSELIQAGVGLGIGAKVAKTVVGSVEDSIAVWTCTSCGHGGNKGTFCENCGTERNSLKNTWQCPNCGQSGLVGNFCPTCGTKRKE